MRFVLQDDRRRAEAVCGRGGRSGQQLHEGGGVLVSNEEKEQFHPLLDVTSCNSGLPQVRHGCGQGGLSVTRRSGQGGERVGAGAEQRRCGSHGLQQGERDGNWSLI